MTRVLRAGPRATLLVEQRRSERRIVVDEATLLLMLVVLRCGGAQPSELPSPDDEPAPSDEQVEQLEADFEGPGGLMQFFDANSDETIANALDARGVGFARNATALTECEPTFAASARETWHAFDGEFYYIEAHGRRSRAYKYLPPVVEADRIEACQRDVGEWGDAEDSENDYDGGHMMADVSISYPRI